MKLKDMIGSMASKFAALALALVCAGNVWATTVATEAELRAAIANGGTVTLGGNIALTQGEIAVSNTVTLDLATFTISSPTNVFRVAANGNFTVNADATNPGGISTTATNACVYTAYGLNPGPKTIVLNRGVFSGNCVFNFSQDAANNIQARFGIPVSGYGSGEKADPTSVTINGGVYTNGWYEGNVGAYRCYYFTVNGGTFERGLDCADTPTCSIGVTTTCKAYFNGGRYRDRYPTFRRKQYADDPGKVFIGTATHTNVYYYADGYYVNAYDYSACQCTGRWRGAMVEDANILLYFVTQCWQNWMTTPTRKVWYFLTEADAQSVNAGGITPVNGAENTAAPQMPAADESVRSATATVFAASPLKSAKRLLGATSQEVPLAKGNNSESDNTSPDSVSSDWRDKITVSSIADWTNSFASVKNDDAYITQKLQILDAKLDAGNIDDDEYAVLEAQVRAESFKNREDMDACYVFNTVSGTTFKTAEWSIVLKLSKVAAAKSMEFYLAYGNQSVNVDKRVLGALNSSNEYTLPINKNDNLGDSSSNGGGLLSNFAMNDKQVVANNVFPFFVAIKNTDSANEGIRVEVQFRIDDTVCAAYTHDIGEYIPEGKKPVEGSFSEYNGNNEHWGEYDSSLKDDSGKYMGPVYTDTRAALSLAFNAIENVSETGLESVTIAAEDGATQEKWVQIEWHGLVGIRNGAPMTTFAFGVEPMLAVTAGNETTTRSITNTELNNQTIKFHLPLTDAYTARALVVHTSDDANYPEERWIANVAGSTGARYVEISTTHFSEFTVSPLGADDIVYVTSASGAFIGGYTTLADAYAATEDGGTIYLLQNVSKNIEVSTAKTFNINANGFTYSGAVTAAEGFGIVESTSGASTTYTVFVAVAQIGTTKYETLADAIAAVTDNTATTITILADVDLGTLTQSQITAAGGNAGLITIPAGKVITLDLNGHRLYGTLQAISSGYNKNHVLLNRGTLTVVDSGTGGSIENLGTDCVDCCYTIENDTGATMYLNGGTFSTASGALMINRGTCEINSGVEMICAGWYRGSYSNASSVLDNRGTVTINGGTFRSTHEKSSNGKEATATIFAYGTTTINGGTFIGQPENGVFGGTDSYYTITGGSFSSDPQNLVDSTAYYVRETSGMYTVSPIVIENYNVATSAELLEKLALADAESRFVKCKLTDDITLSADAVVAHGSQIELNGHTLTVGDGVILSNDGTIISGSDGSTVRISRTGFLTNPYGGVDNENVELVYANAADGNGVYEISTPMDLQWLSYFVNTADFIDDVTKIVFADDIAIPSGVGFEMIGGIDNKEIDGNGKSVSGVVINGISGEYGMFEYLAGVYIHDLDVTASVSTVNAQTGILAARIKGGTTVKNVAVNGRIDVSGSAFGVAGFAGAIGGGSGEVRIVCCTNNADIYAPNATIAGGFHGTSSSFANGIYYISCENTGDMTSGGYAAQSWGYGYDSLYLYDFTGTGDMVGSTVFTGALGGPSSTGNIIAASKVARTGAPTSPTFHDDLASAITAAAANGSTIMLLTDCAYAYELTVGTSLVIDEVAGECTGITAPSGYVVEKTVSGTIATYSAVVPPVAQIVRNNEVVAKYATLAGAIEAAQAGDTVQLLADVNLAGVTINLNKGLTLDGDGHDLTTTASAKAIYVNTSAAVTIKNINIPQAQRGVSILPVQAFHVTVSNVTMLVSQRGITFDGGCTAESELNVVDCEFRLAGTGDGTPYKNDQHYRGISAWDSPGATFNITDSKIDGFAYDINVAGDHGSSTFNIAHSEFSGRAMLNVWSSGNTFNVTDCEINGYNWQTGPTESFGCIVANNGSTVANNNIFNINQCRFTANLSQAASSEGGNASQQMFAIRGYNSTVILRGNTVSYEASIGEEPTDPSGRFGFEVYESHILNNNFYLDTAATNALAAVLAELATVVPVAVTEGVDGSPVTGVKLVKAVASVDFLDGEAPSLFATFADAIAAADAAGVDEIRILDGTTTSPDSNWKVENGLLVRKVYVAQIGETKYETLQDAVAAAQAGDTIEVIADDEVSLTGGQEVTINKPLTITGAVDEDGIPVYTIYGTADNTGYNDIFVASSSGTVTISNLGFTEFGYQAAESVNGHAPIVVSSGNNSVVLENLYIYDFNRTGIKINGGEFLVTNCFIDCSTYMENYRIGGVDVANAATGAFVGTTITDVGTSDSTKWVSAALELIGSGAIRVEDCEFSSAINGVFVSTAAGTSPGSSAVTVINTTIEADMYSLANDSDAEGAVIAVQSGTFTGPLNSLADTGLSISGGYFSQYVTDIYCAPAYLCTTRPVLDELYQVVPAATVTYTMGENPPTGAALPSPASFAYPSGDKAEIALTAATCTDGGYTFAGWMVKNSDPEVILSAIPAGANTDYELVATWTGAQAIEITVGDKTATIKVTDEWLYEHGLTGKSVGEIRTALEATPEGGKKPVWQSYVLGQDVDAAVTSDAEQGETTLMPVTSTIDVPAADTGFDVQYRLDMVKEDGTIITAGTPQDTPDLAVELSDISGSAYYKLTAVVTAKDGSGASVTVPADNTIGVLKVESSATSTVIAVPWEALADDGGIKVADLVRTATLSEGDELKVYDPSTGTYKVWTLNSSKEWEPNTTVTESGSSLAPSAYEYSVPRGVGVWLTRTDTTQPIYLVGEVAEQSTTTTIAGAQGNEPTWNLVAAPTVEAVNLNVKFPNANEGDVVLVPTDGAPKRYTYKDGSWGYDDYVKTVNKRGIEVVKVVRNTDVTNVPIGTGFWYMNAGDAKNVVW